MKKVFALLLAVVLVMSFSMAVSAANSPEGVSYYKVYIIVGPGADTDVTKVAIGEEVTVTADPDYGTFDKWMFYTMDGDEAIEGIDYTLVSGVATDETITFIPLTNIIVTGNYNGKITKVEITKINA